jgi:hypothetical protein
MVRIALFMAFVAPFVAWCTIEYANNCTIIP